MFQVNYFFLVDFGMTKSNDCSENSYIGLGYFFAFLGKSLKML